MSDLLDWRRGGRGSIPIARVDNRSALPATLRAIGLEPSRPVLVIVGGAAGMTAAEMDRLRPLFIEGLAPLAEVRAVVVVDGGTNAGVMRLMGEARSRISATFPLVGVAPTAKVLDPGDTTSSGSTPLEPHHSHVVLAPARTWTDGAPWIAWVADEIAGDARSVTVLVDGGDVSWLDAEASITAGRPVIAIAGTGRIADELAAALAEEPSDDRAHDLVASGLVTVADFAEGPTSVAAAVGRFLDTPH